MKKPGLGVLIAVGRPRPNGGAPPPYKAPRPEGDGEKPESATPAPSPKDPDAGRPEQSVAISPEAVSYHTGDVNCSNCEYMQDDGQCRVLKMPVGPSDWCKAHEDKGGGDMDQGGGMSPMSAGGDNGGGGY